MRIYQGTASDIERWLHLRRALWPETTEQRHRMEIAAILSAPEEQVVFFCLSPVGEFLGFAEVSLRKSPCAGCLSSPVGCLEGWYVIETARGQGVGARLVQVGEKWARSKGCTEMASDTEIENTASEAAHKRLGYEEVARVICFRKSLQGKQRLSSVPDVQTR